MIMNPNFQSYFHPWTAMIARSSQFAKKFVKVWPWFYRVVEDDVDHKLHTVQDDFPSPLMNDTRSLLLGDMSAVIASCRVWVVPAILTDADWMMLPLDTTCKK